MLNSLARSAMSNFWWFLAASRILDSNGPSPGVVGAFWGEGCCSAMVKVGHESWGGVRGGGEDWGTLFSSDVFLG